MIIDILFVAYIVLMEAVNGKSGKAGRLHKYYKNLYAMEGCGALRKIYYRGQSDSAYKLIPSLSHKLEGYVEDEDNYIAI